MELKLIQVLLYLLAIVLLIVPYGIETWNFASFSECTVILLIVPYGIETN